MSQVRYEFLCFLLYYRHINFDVPKVMKMSPQVMGQMSPPFLNPRQNTGKLRHQNRYEWGLLTQ